MTESKTSLPPLTTCHNCTPEDKDCALYGWPCPFRLDTELALITGGGSGLGLAMARCMADAGARVVLAGRREEVLRQAVESIGPRAHYICHDVTQLGEAPALVAKIQEQYGPITVAINNAGIHLKKPAIETTEEEFLKVLTTHVLGSHAICRAVAPGMIERRGGSILFIASMASFIGVPNVVAYSAAKSAYVGMVRALASELSPLGVRVNAIAPGWILTDMARQALQNDPKREQKILSRTPMGTFGLAEDIGMAAVYLCSPAAKFITGAVLPVDGGASIGF
ncbi:MAG: SDR family oxidoreductase [Pirellulales bacterium]|nr:SDR family oxidoreductase [Pirellulales bacterium]